MARAAARRRPTLGDDRPHEALASARAVLLVLALTPRTQKLIGRAEPAVMEQGAWLINVARGKVVNTQALVKAFRSGQITGAALDVTDPESLPTGHPLWDLPQLPHHAAHLRHRGNDPATPGKRHYREHPAADGGAGLVGRVDQRPRLLTRRPN
jgi:phosphoglycerate dehydrogenase-like enzyme